MYRENKIKTRDFGEITVKKEDIINFTDGMYGFEDYKRYIILKDAPGDDVLFLQSLDNMELSFVLIDPYAIFKDYNPVLTEEDLRELNTIDEDELKYLVIAIIKEDVRQSVVNLKSPVAINPKLKTAKQVILQNSYPLRYSIISTGEGNEC